MAAKSRRGGPRVEARPATRTCRVCGGDVPQAGDLCPTCRRAAADALRQAASSRLHQGRALSGDPSAATAGDASRAAEERRRQAREDERVRLQREEAAREQEREAQRDRDVEESRQRSRAAVESDEVVSPFAILGVPPGADRAAIDAAYEAARLKYSSDQVAHLSPEIQEHYRQKAEAVERAYLELSG
jgi:hypothetical protein